MTESKATFFIFPGPLVNMQFTSVRVLFLSSRMAFKIVSTSVHTSSFS